MTMASAETPASPAVLAYLVTIEDEGLGHQSKIQVPKGVDDFSCQISRPDAHAPGWVLHLWSRRRSKPRRGKLERLEQQPPNPTGRIARRRPGDDSRLYLTLIGGQLVPDPKQKAPRIEGLTCTVTPIPPYHGGEDGPSR